jgi:hypothetical protein
MTADSPPMQQELVPKLVSLADREFDTASLAGLILEAFDDYADSDSRLATLGSMLLIASSLKIVRVFAPSEPQTTELLDAIEILTSKNRGAEKKPRSSSHKKKRHGTKNRSGGSIPSSFELSKRAAEARKKHQK